MNKSLKCLGAKFFNRSGFVRKCDTSQSAVRILMYHKVNDTPDCLGLTVSPELFDKQLSFLADNYEIITLADAFSRLVSGCLSDNYCVLTFDDGYRDNYEIAAPILKEHNLPATIFVTYDAVETGQFGWGEFDRTLLTTSAGVVDLSRWDAGAHDLKGQDARENAVIQLHCLLKSLPDSVKQEIVAHVVTTFGADDDGERVMMTWPEVCSLAVGELVTIGAHTVSHPILSRIPKEQVCHEVLSGKHLLEEKLGRPVDFFAYPNGGRDDFNPDVVAIVKEAGYKAACSTIFGHNGTGCDLFELKRIDVTNSMSTDTRQRFSPDLFAFSLSGIFKCR